MILISHKSLLLRVYVIRAYMNGAKRAHTIITCLMTNAKNMHVFNKKRNALHFTEVFFAFAKQQIKIDICLIECFKTDFNFDTTVSISFMYFVYVLFVTFEVECMTYERI